MALEKKVVMINANMMILMPNSNVRKKIRMKLPLSKISKVKTRAATIEITNTITE